jgi:hypothetical protein
VLPLEYEFRNAGGLRRVHAERPGAVAALTTFSVKWLLPWASVLIASSALAYALTQAVVGAASQPAPTVSSDTHGNAELGGCFSAVEVLRLYGNHLTPHDAELLATNLCSPYVVGPAAPS